MRQHLLPAVALVLVCTAADSCVSARRPPAAAAGSPAELAARAGWKGVCPNSDQAFSFVVMADRTGGHEPGEWEEAVAEVNLLKPDFVISVGDLIEGYAPTEAELEAQWREVEGMIGKLDAPFFYCPGNHDVATRNPTNANPSRRVYRSRHGVAGQGYYSFDYRGSHFIVLDSAGAKEDAAYAGRQFAWLRKDVAAASRARHFFVFYHHPLWAPEDTSGLWQELRAVLPKGKTTIFNGHWHALQYREADGFPTYVLACTGAKINAGPPRHADSSRLAELLATPNMKALLGEDRATGEFRMFARVAVDGGRPTISLLPLHEVLPGSFADDVTMRNHAVAWAGTSFETGPTGGDVVFTPSNLLQRPLAIDLSWAAAGWTAAPTQQVVHLAAGQRGRAVFRLARADSNAAAPVLIAEHVLPDGRRFTITHDVSIWEKADLGKLADVALDGSLDEWAGVPSVSLGKVEQFFQGVEKWQGPADGSATMRAAVCGDRLALGIEVTDDAFSTDAGSPRENDAIEFFWDARRPADRNGQHGPGTGQLIIQRCATNGIPDRMVWMAAGKGRAAMPADVRVVTRQSAHGYTLEVLLPLREMGAAVAPAQGDEICLELMLDDRDGVGKEAVLKRLSGNGRATCSSSTAAYWRFRLR